MYAPIVIFVYNRPEKTIDLLNSLSKNSEASNSNIYIFSDGPKLNASNLEIEEIEMVRQICRNENRFLNTKIFQREKNIGLAKSIIDGVTHIVNLHGKVIVLEDDLILSPFFLKFMNDSLYRYEKNKKVGSIGGCNYFAYGEKYSDFFFFDIPDSLGWGTWKDRWEKFDEDPFTIYNKIIKSNNLVSKFNAHGAYDFIKLLKDQMEGKVDSWAIRWHGTCILNNWKTLYSNPSMTNHIESINATHSPYSLTPPLVTKTPFFKTIRVVVGNDIINSYIKFYNNHPDSYQNSLKANSVGFIFYFKRLKEKILIIVKKIIKKIFIYDKPKQNI